MEKSRNSKQKKGKGEYSPHKSKEDHSASGGKTSIPFRSSSKAYRPSEYTPSHRNCGKCGGNLPHSGPCPAKGKLCGYCKKPNHFLKVCRKLKFKNRQRNKVHGVSESGDCVEESSTPIARDRYSSSEDDYCFHIGKDEIIGTVGKKAPKLAVKINGVKCELMIDTGASVNILDQRAYKKVGLPKLMTRRMPKLFPYGGGPALDVIGQCELFVEANSKVQKHKFYVVPGDSGSIMGYSSATDMELIYVIQGIEDIESKYPQLYKGIGKLNDRTVKIHIDETVPPVALKHRRTPFHLRDKVETELNKLLSEDIIEKVEGTPTPWVSPIVTPPKKDPDSIRICVDMREPNKAIQRERHQMPTVSELIADLNGSTVFSKLDLRAGYHQLELEPESRSITTFATHISDTNV